MSQNSQNEAAAINNFDVDYVVSYRYLDTGIISLPQNLKSLLGSRFFPPVDTDQAIKQFQKLVRALAEVGLQTEVRNGENHTLLVFVKALDEEVLANATYRSRYARDVCRSKCDIF